MTGIGDCDPSIGGDVSGEGGGETAMGAAKQTLVQLAEDLFG